MLTLIAFSAALMQEPPAPPPPPPAPPEVRARVMMGPGGGVSLDKDGDGHVSREEFAAPMTDHFARMDKNGDGRLSTEEMTSGHGDHDVVVMRRPGGPGGHDIEVRSPGGGATWAERDGDRTAVFIGGPGGPHGDGERHMEIVALGGEHGEAKLDKDGDGRISEAEFTAQLREAFARLDADHSGFIEDAEGGPGRNVHVFTQRIETREESDQ